MIRGIWLQLQFNEDRILRNISNHFEHEEEENYFKPIRANNSWSNNHIEYESKGNRDKTRSAEECLNKIRPYLKDIIKKLKKTDTWKIQLAIANSFICCINKDEECAMHSKSDNIEIMIKRTFRFTFWIDIKISYNQWKLVSLYSIMFIYRIISIIK